MCKKWAGSLQVGLTAVPVVNDIKSVAVPSSLSQLHPAATWFITRSDVWHDGRKIRDNYCPSLDHVDVDDVIGITRSSAGRMHLFVNGHDMGVAAAGILQVTFACICIDSEYFAFIYEDY